MRKPTTVVQNLINAEQTGVNIARIVDYQYDVNQYGHHLCSCCEYGDPTPPDSYFTNTDALYDVYNTEDFKFYIYAAFEECREYIESMFDD